MLPTWGLSHPMAQSWPTKRTRSVACLVCLGWVVGGLSVVLHGQNSDRELPGTPVIRLTFDEVTARVGQEVALPIRATASTSLQIPFKVILRFPPSRLQYEKLGIGRLPRQAGWELGASLRKTPANFDMTFLEIQVQPSGQEFFPKGGLLAEAYFTVIEADKEHAIELAPSVKAIGESELDFETERAFIVALPAAMFACFFYMH